MHIVFFETGKKSVRFHVFCILLADIETSPLFKLIFKRLICYLKPRWLQYSVFDNLLHSTCIAKKANAYFCSW